ncbi:MFS general substrate transporter [Polyporus arcularius HHB13444]|uniref:MFS general substrate transporter n=1 Tax=Polyporus arcularius HHB13444 TaxID=1314778 RepID=A0A5C3P303_9APHY|nr:MFS general substrate transporter [Polyporus arcularius HHB13444]
MEPELKDEKKFDTVLVLDADSEVDLRDKDEALRLVGLERTAQFTEEYYARLRRKLDLVIPPLCAAVYCTQYLHVHSPLDKTALSYASIMGFPVTGQGYNLVALSFYIGFLIWVFPSMFIAQRLRLGKYLGANIVAWGIVMMLHAIPRSFGPFFALRLLLGMLESCVAPILILIISMFYKKNEQGSRMAWFYMMNGVAGIFGGFLAYGISFIPDRGFAPFKIMYLMLGSLAIAVGISVLLFMPDSPTNAQFLTKEERIAAIERIRDQQSGTENKRLKKEQVLEALLDIKTWLIVLATLLTNIPNGGLANFTNIIVKGFGYTTKQTLILSTPGGAIGILSAVLCGWYSDRAGERMLPIVWSLIPTLAGAAMLVGLNGTGQKGALLFATWIVGTYGSSLAIIYAYNASNTSGHTKKVTVNAMTLAAFCVANIVGTETFLPKDAPGYLPGKISILVLLSAQLALCFIIRWVNLWMNRKKRRTLEELKRRNGWTDEDVLRERERAAFIDMTDKQNPFFEYTA